jgi:hypothetical protein
MLRMTAAFAVLVAVTGCGSDERRSSAGESPADAVSTGSYVASPTVARGTAGPLFAIPGMGRFSKTCNGRGLSDVRYRAAVRGADELVTHSSTLGSSTLWLRPGDGLAVGPRGGRKDFQIAILTEGRVTVATASFTAGTLKGSSSCFVSAKADVSTRQR